MATTLSPGAMPHPLPFPRRSKEALDKQKL